MIHSEVKDAINMKFSSIKKLEERLKREKIRTYSEIAKYVLNGTKATSPKDFKDKYMIISKKKYHRLLVNQANGNQPQQPNINPNQHQD